MKSSNTNKVMALIIIAIGIALAAGGFYVGATDDAPGAFGLGLLLLIVAIVLGVKIARRKQRDS